MPQQVSPAAPFFPCAHRAGGDDSHFAMRRILNAAVLPGGLALAVVLRAAVPFPQADSDLRADPAARYGALPNGLRYVVLPNHEPKQRASMRLLVLAGSFGETESQRGLAHFLEHMAFNGSTHYAAGALAEKLRRLGMGAGADSNASTSFDRTVYHLELPDTAAATLADGLRILADYAGGLLIEPALVEKERGVILGEKRTRDTVGYRTLVAQLEFIEAGTRVPERLPIGLDSVIGKARREPLASFYNTWYRPELMAVIVVGDVDGAAIERQIVEGFSGLAPRGPRPPAIDLGHVADFKGVRTLFPSEPQAPATRIAIASTVPFPRQPDTAARRIDRLPRTLAFAMLNRRLSARPIRGSASVREAYNLFREADVDVGRAGGLQPLPRGRRRRRLQAGPVGRGAGDRRAGAAPSAGARLPPRRAPERGRRIPERPGASGEERIGPPLRGPRREDRRQPRRMQRVHEPRRRPRAAPSRAGKGLARRLHGGAADGLGRPGDVRLRRGKRSA